MPAGSTGMVISPTFRMLADSTLACFLDLTRTGGVLSAFNKSDMVAQLVNGTRILFRSADNPDSLRGTNLGWFFLDEGALCDREVWLILIARLRESPGRAWVCTTPRGFDWLWETFVKNATADYAVIHSRTHDNTFLPRGFITRLEEQYTAGWQQQELMGEFCDLEGALFRRAWFKTIPEAPAGLKWFRYWDLAASTKTQADFTASACAAIDKDSGDIILRDLIKVKAEWPDVRRLILATVENEPDIQLGIENALHGLPAVQELHREPALANISLRSINVTKDKVSRSLPVASRAEAGHVKLVDGPWVKDWLDECTVFPHGAHDDQVDAVSGAVQMIGEHKRRILWA